MDNDWRERAVLNSPAARGLGPNALAATGISEDRSPRSQRLGVSEERVVSMK